jgi:AraC-like DNA-binding protein
MSGTFASGDLVADALHLMRMTGTFYCRSELSAPWGLELPAREGVMSFHVVTRGSCYIATDGAETVKLDPGDLALVPHGAGHVLSSQPGTPAARQEDLPHETVSESYAVLRHGGGGAASTLICGAVRFDHPAASQLTAAMPRIITVRADGSLRGDWLQSTIRFIAEEAEQRRPGGETVITRLADVLVIQAIRAWLEKDPAGREGWLGALRDERIGRVLMMIHREPSRRWTVGSLAREGAMSRSAFAARFSSLVGETPMHYVTRWRMHVARARLQGADPGGLGELAGRVGYRSEAAFQRAFKRHVGAPPGRVRRGSVPAAPGGSRAARSTPPSP